MFIYKNKYLAVISAILIIAVLGGLYGCSAKQTEPTNLPVVRESDFNTPAPKDEDTPKESESEQEPDINYSNVDLPVSDNEGLNNVIKDFYDDGMTEEELEQQVALEKEQGTVVTELTPEKIEEDNKVIEQAQKEAEKNSEVQKPFGQPMQTEPPESEPERDADGYLYTKEEVIEIFANEFKKMVDTKTSAYAYALEDAKKHDDFNQAEFDSDVQQLLTDPYSSKYIATVLDGYRKDGDMDVVIYTVYNWLANGGDDGKWYKTSVQ